MTDSLSEARKKDWADPEKRARRCEALRLAALRRYADPGQRKASSERAKAFYREPDNKARHNAAMRAMGDRVRGRSGTAAGKSRTATYGLWRAMNARCRDPKGLQYADYGGRGIRVCKQWRGQGGFVRFLADIGERPSKAYSLGRIDNDGNYEPGNVRWETREQQSGNTRRTRLLTIGGITMHQEEWARQLGVRSAVLAYRVRNWPEERWLEPVRRWQTHTLLDRVAKGQL